MTLLAYHSDTKIKRKYMRRVAAHRKADELCQGVGFESNGETKGCAVGCTFDSYDHTRGPVEIGVPEVLMHLEDAIFEGLSEKDALEWPTQFLAAIQVGADLSLVWPRFAVWLMSDKKHGVIQYAGEDAEVKAAIERVDGLYKRWVETGVQPPKEDFESAAIQADSAWARSSAWASASASAWASARSSAWASVSARSSAWASAWASEIHWRACRDELLRLLKDSPTN